MWKKGLKTHKYSIFWTVQICLLFFVCLSVSARYSVTVSQLLAPLFPTTVFTYTYDTDTPAGTDAPSVIDDRIREVKDALQERLNVDHYFALTGSEVSDADAGEHRKILFHVPIASTPTVADSHGDLRIMDVDSAAELTWTDEAENELVLTDVGTLNIVSSDLTGTLANDTYFSAVDNAGTGTVDLIKANTSDVAVLPNDSQTATSAAPTTDASLANKKYVDDNIGSTNWSPTLMTGSTNSIGTVTCPNGLIMKWGKHVIAAASGTTTFATAFPNACFQVISCSGSGNPNFFDYQIVTITTANFTWVCGDVTLSPLRWFAIGR